MMAYRTLFIVVAFLFSLFGKVQAQFQQVSCQDSTLINYNPCYGTLYQPVCGCDNITYRNECNAYAQGLVSFVEGPCEPMDFDITPNPAITDFILNIATLDVLDVNVWIFDAFFRQKYYQLIPSVYPYTLGGGSLFPVNVDVRGFGNGVFFVVLRAGGVTKVKRILVNQIQP